jgi:uncharacterized membrane protein YadS
MAFLQLLPLFALLLILAGAFSMTLSLPDSITRFLFRWAAIFVVVRLLALMYIPHR